ncbi:MAG: phosphate ABC transporter permease PstA [Proteobacteria bacterium]|nr:phosphate ABC transporter permease PstA [Pseudomonadota bacterium]
MNKKLLARRYRHERFFMRCGLAGIALAFFFLALLLVLVIGQGWRTFLTASIQLEVQLDSSIIGAAGEESPLRYQKLLKDALRQHFPQVKKRQEKKQLYQLLSFSGAVELRQLVQEQPDLLDTRATVWLPAASAAERYLKGGIDPNLAEEQRGISDRQLLWLDTLAAQEAVELSFNSGFFTNADSRDAELAGIGGALLGSFYSLLLAFLFSFPVGVLAAVYLELFAPRNRWFDFIEINVNNLAAVPSVIFGLLGLSIFINFFGLPRSSSLVGGLVLSLMTLPTIVIAARAALAAVPPSLLAAALSLGATKMQGVFHHVLPNAIPGILTGAIIGMARALGETAPLLMIGMVAFIVELPEGVADSTTALPVQIFLWADSPERGFVERTSAAIIVLLFFLLLMNAVAIYIRNKMEDK